MKCKITAPNKEFTGEIAGVPFLKGEAITDNQLAIDYCLNKGYTVEEVEEDKKIQLSKLRVDELKELAKAKGIEGGE